MYNPVTLRGLSSPRLLGSDHLRKAASKFRRKTWVDAALREQDIDPQSASVTRVRNTTAYLA